MSAQELCANPTFFGESLAGGEEEGGGEGSGDDAATALAGQYLDDVGADRYCFSASKKSMKKRFKSK